MAKKPRVKGETKLSEAEMSGAGKELYIPVPQEGGIIDFYYLCLGFAGVMIVISVGDILLHYVLHIL